MVLTDSDKRYAIEMQQYAAEEYKAARAHLWETLRYEHRYLTSHFHAVHYQMEGDAFARCARRAMGVE